MARYSPKRHRPRGSGRALLILLAGGLLAASPIAAEIVNTKLNGPMAPGGNERELQIHPDGEWVVYVADQDTDGALELFSVPIAGGWPPESGPLYQADRRRPTPLGKVPGKNHAGLEDRRSGPASSERWS